MTRNNIEKIIVELSIKYNEFIVRKLAHTELLKRITNRLGGSNNNNNNFTIIIVIIYNNKITKEWYDNFVLKQNFLLISFNNVKIVWHSISVNG